MATELERIAVLEATIPPMAEQIKSMDSKIDILLEAHYKQKGSAHVWGLVWSGAVGLVGAIAGVLGAKQFGH